MTPTEQKKLGRFPLAKKLGSLQDAIGRAKSVYQNDRDTMRADKLIPLLDEAFALIVEIRSRRYKR